MKPALAIALAAAVGASGLRVEVSGLRNGAGHLLCELFASPQGFPTDPGLALARASAPISEGRATCDFAELPRGRYAVAVVHDENDSGGLDRNFLGLPAEGVGASRNAHGHLGPPSFDDASFDYSGGFQELEIKVTYPP